MAGIGCRFSLTSVFAVARAFGALVLTVSLFVAAPSISLPFASTLTSGGPSSDGSYDPGSSWETGVVGNISIANITPVCYNSPNPNPSNSNITVVATSLLGRVTIIPVRWSTFGGCELFGTFRASLDPGTYSLTLSYCLGSQSGPYQPAGCPHAACGIQSCNLPITIDVKPGKLTPVKIDITTGIY